MLANLPDKVRVTWADHRLYGTELPVHGWQHVHDEVHLLVTLPDGSRGYLPASGTSLWSRQAEVDDRPVLMLTGGSVRQLRQLTEALQARGRRRRRSAVGKSK